jgi:hypothetical protein
VVGRGDDDADEAAAEGAADLIEVRQDPREEGHRRWGGDQHAEGLEHDVIERRLLLALFGGGLGLEKGADARRARAGAEGSRWSNLSAPFSCAGKATFCFV